MNMSQININGTKITVTGDCTNVSIINGEVVIDDVTIEGSKNVVDVHVTGNVGSIKCNGSVDVSGDVTQGIDCGSSVKKCGNVGGNVDAGNSVTCGNVEGNVDAGNSVTCGTVGGDVDAGGSVKMRR